MMFMDNDILLTLRSIGMADKRQFGVVGLLIGDLKFLDW